MEWIYRGAMRRRRARALTRRQTEAVPCPVVSVGNLSTGGTGKTPAVMWLCRALQGEGWRVGIAARGYGGSAGDAGALVSDGKTVLLSAREAGDEAWLHARALPGVIVAVARDRHRAVELCARNGAQIVVLDDGFQFWSLPRAFDLVLLDAKSPFGNGHLLPWGRGREEPAALRRADAVLLTRAARATPEELAAARQQIGRWTRAPLFLCDHAPRDLRDEKTDEIVSLGYLARREVKAFAGLADNAQFYALLQGLGAQLVRLRRERGDHHLWKPSDFRWFEAAPPLNAQQREKFAALPVVTTEKDAVKLDPRWFDGRLLSLRIGLRIERETALARLVFAKLSRS